MSDRVPYLASRLQGFGTTIFAEMSALAVETGSVNLGQGFPDTDGPPEVMQAAIDAIRRGENQYPPGPGIADLRLAIAEHQQHWYGLHFDPDTEILVTAGATEAIAAALLSLCEPGDEVVTFEPYYDSYSACIAMAGATHRLVQLTPPGYAFDPDALRAAITPRTRLLLVNSPHNPTGKVLSRESSRSIAALCLEHDLIAVTDEVYEHIVFDGAHIPLATLPGMRDRVVTISSGGKSFSCTGWKIGWVCASPPLVRAVRTAKQFLTYVNGGAVPAGDRRRTPPARRADQRPRRSSCATKRDRLSAGLIERGLRPCTRRPARTSSLSTSGRSASTTGTRSVGRCPSGAASSRSRTWCSTTTWKQGRRSCGSRSARSST